MDAAQVMAMATACPQLVARLLIGVMQRPQVQEQQGQGSTGDRKRARE